MHMISLIKTQDWQGTAAILIACLLWGTTGTAASFTHQVSPLATGAFAMGVGGLLLVLSSWNYLKRDWGLLKQQQSLVLFGGLAVAVYPMSFYSSMDYAGVAVGSVMSLASAPFWSALLEGLISKTKVSRRWIFSFAIGILGIALLALSEGHSAQASSVAQNYNLGVMLGLLTGLTYAFYSWSTKRLIQHGLHSKAAMSSQFAVATVLLLPSLVITGDHLFSSTTNTVIAVYMATIPMFLGYLAFGYGLRFIAASKATLLTLSEPVIASLLAVVVVGERINTQGAIGIVLIMVCLFAQAKGKE
ncbi:DMT family transporter [Endozoicomonas arenosclerae]|uniref:DMT family transporter n=1 Tax=Endozoicomonas arenosclerae TaxID=1633495 RepID=UPI000AF26F8C|nr:EamA family transporter [Endozoicomonas arenosclerae]